jgi:soluble epoxide hydrolase / lipid-phosphate phosphatase
MGAARAWITADTQTEIPSWMDADYKDEWLTWMSQPNAIEAGLNCYRSQYGDVNVAEESKFTDEDWLLHVPVLAIGGSRDPVARVDFMERTEDWARAGYESHILDGGHWLSMEFPEEVNELLIEFGQA